ncbi:MAG: hypothetical protein HRU01_08890 [Myxococcales bacterium]|nr:hypothetical protein [Myxococcales bacterium]
MGSFAVVAALVALYFQVRQNTNQLRDAAHAATMAEHSKYCLTMATNPNALELMLEGSAGCRTIPAFASSVSQQ